MCNTSLHKLKDEKRGLKEMSFQCSRLLECLPAAILATEQAAPCGNKGPHPLFRDPRPHLANPKGEWRECHWEEALWRKYGQDNSAAVPGFWSRLLSYQVMLRNTNKGDAGWGEIDLLAVTANGSPAVVELKQEGCKKSPLRLLMEGCAYAIAVKKCWSAFGPRFVARIANIELASRSLQQLQPQEYPVICLAPQRYWSWCLSVGDLQPAWPIFHQLIARLTELGFPVSFAAVHHEGKDEFGLPKIIGISHVFASTGRA